MSRSFHFIAGLPRSGSTLMAAILRQNPDIVAGMSSPVGQITSALRVMMTQNKEISALIDDAGRARILRGIFDGYYSDYDEKSIIVDTSRGWTGRIPELLALFPDVRIIAMVRDPAWMLDSVETLIRKNPLRQSGMVKPGANIDQRAEAMIAPDGFIGNPLGNLKEAVYGPDCARLMLLDYRALCIDPEQALSTVYTFLKIPPFEHNFKSVAYEQPVFDEALHTPGLHTVKGAVEHRPRKTILPPEIFARMSASAFWQGDLPPRVTQVLPKTYQNLVR